MKRLLIVPLLIAACSAGPGATPVAPTGPPAASPVVSAPSSPSPTASALPSPTQAATTSPSQAPAASEAPSVPASPAGGGALLIGLDPTGTFLVTPEGFALYTFDNDLETIGDSTCVDDCAGQWPPLEDPLGADTLGGEGVTGAFFPILRIDGIRQVSYNDLPLYTYVGDEAPGDTNGDGLGGVWHLATPESCHTVIGCDE